MRAPGIAASWSKKRSGTGGRVEHGGWSGPFFEPESMGTTIGEVMGRTDAKGDGGEAPPAELRGDQALSGMRRPRCAKRGGKRMPAHSAATRAASAEAELRGHNVARWAERSGDLTAGLLVHGYRVKADLFDLASRVLP